MERAPNTAEAPRRNPQKRQRRTLSCLPCRLRKVRCDRVVPCQNCCRRGHEDQCRSNPAEGAGLTAAPRTAPSTRKVHAHPPLGFPAGSPQYATTPSQQVLPPTPSSSATGENEPSGSRQARRDKDRWNPTGIPDMAFNSTRGNEYSVTGEAADGGKSVATAILFRPNDMLQQCVLDESATFWKHYLIGVLPSQTQCDIFVSYFFENLNWMYHSIHGPSFRSDYAALWNSRVDDVDLVFLSLLFMILGLGAFFAPSSITEAVGLNADTLSRLHRRWYGASRQALQAGEFDSKPTLMAVQVFIVSQSYWYCTKNIEALNSHMGQTIRNAQALGLDKEAPPSITDRIEREMRHRIWWDLVCSDTFQSMCLGRPTLLQSHQSTVPFPSNCNDVDMTPTSIYDRPVTEATEMSIHCFRAKLFRILNKLYIDNGAHLSSYDFVAGIDAELTAVIDSYPWHMKDDASYVKSHLPPGLATAFTWMRHALHSAVCLQRVRMFRPFLDPVVGDSWRRCVEASTSALAVYKALRDPDVAQFRRGQKMHVAAYQVVSVAIALATFLLVEMPSNPESTRADIELVISDLNSHSTSVDDSRLILLISDGCRVIQRMLVLYDARCIRRQAMTGSGEVSGDDSALQHEARTALVPAIAPVFGGETSAQRYLERWFTANTENSTSSSLVSLPDGFLDMGAWDALLDPTAQMGKSMEEFWMEMTALGVASYDS